MTTKYRVVEVDGKQYIVIKLAQAMGPNDKLLVISPDGKNELIVVKHLQWLNAPYFNIEINIKDKV